MSVTNDAPETTAPDPLDMALNCCAAIGAIAARQASPDPDVQMQSYIHREGQAGKASAELARDLALVSIAKSLARLADHFAPEPS